MPQGGTELAVAEDVLDAGAVPVPVLCGHRLVRAGHVQVRQDERVGVDRPGAGQLGDRQGALVRVQGAAAPGPRVGGDLGRVQRHPADQQPGVRGPPVRAVLRDGDLGAVHVNGIVPGIFGDAGQQPPQRGDPLGADREGDVFVVGGAGQLPGEIACVGAHRHPPGPGRCGQGGQGAAQQPRRGRARVVGAADLLAGDQDPRSSVVAPLGRALAALPRAVRDGAAAAGRKIALRADAGYFAGDLARAAARQNMAFAIGAKRITSMWRALAGIGEDAWRDAIDMDNAQVAVSPYKPADWPDGTALLVRRVTLDPEQVSADPRSRRRRTLHPDQRALPIPELEQQPAIYAYSFICTNLDVSTPAGAAAVEHWYRHRTSAENIFRDSKLGATLRHLPYVEQVNTAWMWASLIAAAVAAWLHQLTGLIAGGELVEGHGTRGGKAMIATLRRVLIAVPARLVSHGGQLIMRLAPGPCLLPGILATIRALPVPVG